MNDERQRTAASIVLLRRAKDGDPDALNRLFARYYGRVRRIVRLRLGDHLRSAVDSEDILQETFLAAVLAFENFEEREEARLIDWLSKIAENRIRTADRHGRAAKRDRGRVRALDKLRDSITSGELVIEPVAPITLPDQKVIKKEEQGILDQCVAKLKPEYREVIILRDYEGASWETVAQMMGSPGANASRMLHARALVELATAMRRHRD